MRRFYTYLVGALFASVVWAGLGQAPAMAASPSVNQVLSRGPIANPITTFALIDIGSLDCGTDESIVDVDTTAGIPTGFDFHPDSLVLNYIVCPLLDLVYNAVGVIINTLEGSGLLEVRPLLNNGNPSDDSKGIYAAWSVFRDFANFGIIIGLFVVIFSQATSYGLSAYGVKKMLPKIVIAALLVNLSYIMCAILIDIFNILGTSLDNTLLKAIEDRMGAQDVGAIMTGAASTATGAAGSALAAVFMAFLMLSILGILLIFGITAVFFLIGRQILITCLIIAAPLACIAWLFPNTEKQFSKWWSTFIRLLAIYPIVMSMQVVVIVLLVALNALMLSTT